MMKNLLPKNKAQSTIEIVTVVVLVIGALLVFQKYIAQAMYGRWKGVGDSWSFGRQYDPNTTTDCIFDVWGGTDRWYVSECFESQCKLDCIGSTSSSAACATCLTSNCESDVSGVDVCNDQPIVAP